MRLIDADAIEWYGCDFEDYECEHKECKDCRHANCYKPQVDEIPTVQAVPIEVLDKMRAEIEREYNKYRNMSEIWDERACGIGMALDIIDKYTAEKSQAEKSQAEIDYYNWENEILNG